MGEETAASGSGDPEGAFAEFQLHLRQATPHLRVVPALVVINALVWMVMVASGVKVLSPATDEALRWGADYGPLTFGGQPWRLLTNVFVHFGVVHLLANMVALVSAGPVVERLYGPLAFAGIYVAAGIAGGLLSVGVHPVLVSAGASGAIFGIYGALGAFVLRQWGAIPRVVLSKLGVFAVTFIAYNIIYGVGHAGIDNTAHLAGLLGGAAAGSFLVRPLLPGRASAPPRRLALAAVTACVFGFGMALAIPKPVAFETIIKTYGTGEKAVLALHNEMISRLNAGKINMREAAHQIDHATVPTWRTLAAAIMQQRHEWEQKQRPSPAQGRLLDLLEQLIATREDGWTRMSAALGVQDADAFEQTSADAEEAVQGILKQIQDLKSE